MVLGAASQERDPGGGLNYLNGELHWIVGGEAVSVLCEQGAGSVSRQLDVAGGVRWDGPKDDR